MTKRNPPPLRFPEFDGEWQPATLGDFFAFKNGVNADKSMYGRGRKFINVLDVIADDPITYESIGGYVEISDDEFRKNTVEFGDILFQRSSETREEVGQSNIYIDSAPATFGGFVIRGRPKQPIVSEYFHELLKTSAVRRDMTSRSGGSTRYNIGQEALEAVEIWVAPTTGEQNKIASLFKAIRSRIERLRRRQEALKLYKDGMLQRIFSREIRFSAADGNPFPEWNTRKLSELLHQHGAVSTGNEAVHSVSVHKGVIDQVEHLGRSFSAKDTAHYNLAKPGDIIYTKSPTGEFPLGIIKQNRLPYDVIVSPLYGVFTPNTYALGYLINDYFCSRVNTSNYLYPLVQKGAKNTISVTNVQFLSGAITMPGDPEEQEKIYLFLKLLDQKINAASIALETTREFARGLQQKMFI